jgi:hypothetical protein|uniref:Uncharacterized protein n=1 Tax=viral metagenome TaxID=1070528 RepID=A0A6C0IWT4_9ZZZZ
MTAQDIWDNAINMQLSNNTINLSECSNRVTTLQAYCSTLQDGNAIAQRQCASYDNEIERYTATINECTTANAALNNRLWSALSSGDQSSLTEYFTILNDNSFFSNIAIATDLSIASLRTNYDEAINSTSNPGAVPNEVKKDLLCNLFYLMRSNQL